MRKYLAISIVFFFFACSNDVYFEQSSEINEGSWAYGDMLEFEFEVEDTSTYYDLLLEVDHDIDYVYENTYVKIHTNFPNNTKVTDQISLQLADDLDQWEGKCSGNKCTAIILLQKKVLFRDIGQHKIAIEQYNRVDPLEGIKGMTFKILKNTND